MFPRSAPLLVVASLGLAACPAAPPAPPDASLAPASPAPPPAAPPSPPAAPSTPAAALQVIARYPGAPPQPDRAAHVSAVAYSPDGALLASAESSGRVLVRDVAGAVIVRLPDQGRQLSTLAFSPDGRRLLTVAHGDARFWDPRTGAELGRLQLGRMAALTYAPDGRRLVASDDSRVVQLLDAVTGAVVRTLGAAKPDDEIRQNLMTPSAVAFTPDGKRIAVARWDQDVHIWDAATGALVQTVPGLLHAAYSPDGRVLATGIGHISKRRTELAIRLWDTATGRELRTIDAEPGGDFSPAGDLLAALGKDGVELWEVATGRLAARGAAPLHRAYCLAFSPDGKRAATGGGDGSVVVWSLDGLARAPAPR